MNNINNPTREEFYTNYPFFKYWSKSNNKLLNVPKPINIYIHFPFCIQKCDYCYYKTDQFKSQKQVEDYLQALILEISHKSEKLFLKDRPVSSIYIGGGTPSLLKPDQITRLIDTLKEKHSVNKVEFTLECEPGTFSEKKLYTYAENGINRISMGVQSFNTNVIQQSSRKHTAEQAIESILKIKNTKAFKLNIDVLSGLVGDNLQTFLETIKVSLKNEIDMITIYKLKVYANTLFFNKGIRKKEILLPSEEEEAILFENALNHIFENGYKLWTTFAFTKDDYLHRYIENTWRGEDLIAYGASAFGKIDDLLYQNLNITENYIKAVSDSRPPTYRSYLLNAKDNMVRDILLCATRLASYSKEEFIQKYGFNYLDHIPETVKDLELSGYLKPGNSDLMLTKKGIVFSDFVAWVLASDFKKVIGEDRIDFIY